MSGKVLKVSGSLVQMGEKGDAKLYEMVHLGESRIVGEVRRLTKDIAWILAHEATDSLKLGDPTEPAGIPLQTELGPGLLGGAYDGLGRSLEALYAKTGDQITPGTEVSTLDRTKRWAFHPSVTVGAKLVPGDSIGTVQETARVAHKIMVPKGIFGTVAEVHSGERTIEEVIAIVKAPDGTDHKLTMTQNWSIRKERPYKQRHRADIQLYTDAAEPPLILGGTALLIGKGGSGQWVLSQFVANDTALDALDVVVYVASDLSGSACAALIETCKEQAEPRTVLIVNPCDTERAAQEAAVYRGLAIASYYRDMGLNVGLMIDNLTAWVSIAFETVELMGDVIYEDDPPVNLSGRLAELFAPAGVVTCLGTENRQGSLTIIGTLPQSEGFEAMEKSLTRQVDTLWVIEEEQGGCAND